MDNITRAMRDAALAEEILAQFAPGNLTDAEHKQRVAAGKASAEKRRSRLARTPIGVGNKTWSLGYAGGGNRRMYSQWVPHKTAEFGDVTPEKGQRWGYKQFSFTPQKLAGMSDENYTALAQKVGSKIKELREKVITNGYERNHPALERNWGELVRMIPAGTPPADARLAYTHAARIALHELGIGKYQYAMDDELKRKLDPMKYFIIYAKRAIDQEIRRDTKGSVNWRAFKEEFGEPFKKPKYDKVTGQERKRFYPAYGVHNFVKADLPLSKAYNTSAIMGGLRRLAGYGSRAIRAAETTSFQRNARSNYRQQLMAMRPKRVAFGTKETLESLDGPKKRFLQLANPKLDADYQGITARAKYNKWKKPQFGKTKAVWGAVPRGLKRDAGIVGGIGLAGAGLYGSRRREPAY